MDSKSNGAPPPASNNTAMDSKSNGAAPPFPEPAPEPAPATQPNTVYVSAPQHRSNVSSTPDVFLYFIALILPPVPVLLKRGFGADFCINILLWIFGWIPGVIHAWYIISKSEGAM